jgi:hypothetical protein
MLLWNADTWALAPANQAKTLKNINIEYRRSVRVDMDGGKGKVRWQVDRWVGVAAYKLNDNRFQPHIRVDVWNSRQGICHVKCLSQLECTVVELNNLD